MAQADRFLPGGAAGGDAPMGHRPKTNWRRYVYAGWQFVSERARPRPDDETTDLERRVVHHWLIPMGRQFSVRASENPELFRAAIGGYGLFGLISRVTLRLVPRRKLRRVVEVIRSDDANQAFLPNASPTASCTGDFQFSIDEKSPDFLRIGVFSCYAADRRRQSDDRVETPERGRLASPPGAWLHRSRRRRFSDTQITISRPTVRRIGRIQISLALICQTTPGG